MTDKSTQDTEPQTDTPKDFAALLLEIGKGRTHRALSEAVQEITKAVSATGKAGKLQLTLTFKQQKGVDGALLITDEIKTAAPKFDPPTTLFFADDNGDLHRSNPNQPNLF